MHKSIPVLWVLVIILLVLNIVLLYSLNIVRTMAVDTLSRTEVMLNALAHEVIVYDVDVNTDLPINVAVPISAERSVDIETTVQLDTTIPVEMAVARTPLLAYLQAASIDIANIRNRLAPGSQSLALNWDTPNTIAAETTNAGSSAMNNAVDTAKDNVVMTTGAQPTPPPQREPGVEQPTASNSSLTDADPPEESIDLGLCAHAYWPLRPGTAWAFNSAETSYIASVDRIDDSQVYFNTQYEGQDIIFDMTCLPEGLGGGYLGDMRRISELGDLNFSEPVGVFLPTPDVIENVGQSWSQRYKVTGIVEARHGDATVVGVVRQGVATVDYKVLGIEPMESVQGQRQALHVQQQINLDLMLDYNLDNQIVPANEAVSLTNHYWFVRNVGPIKAHWQGGSITHKMVLNDTPIEQQQAVSAMTEDQLALLCVSSVARGVECLSIEDASLTDLTTPANPELEIKPFNIPLTALGLGNGDSTSSSNSTGASPSDSSSNPDGMLPSNTASNLPGDVIPVDSPNFVEYVNSVNDISADVSGMLQDFFGLALAFQSEQITFEDFQVAFDGFKDDMKGPLADFSELNPPPAANAAHEQFNSGLSKCNQALDLLDGYFESSDSSNKDNGIKLATDCISTLTDAKAEIDSLADGG